MPTTIPQPYFINIELFWPDGRRPNQNEIAVVSAYDVYGSPAVTTWEGESGFNGANGGWMPVYMQNTQVFSSRGRPSLQFKVVNTQNQVVHTTQIFDNIAHNSTVRITIGQGAVLVGQEPSDPNWRVYGQITRSDNTVVATGTVRAYDFTNSSSLEIGSAAVDASGNYSIAFTTPQFSANGGSHQTPNVKIGYFDAAGTPVKESEVVTNAAREQQIPLVLDVVPQQPGDHRVFGNISNDLGRPVAGVEVEAVHLAWTTNGIEEVSLGITNANGRGEYDISYTPPDVPNAVACKSAVGEVNLVVYVREADGSRELAQSEPVSPAAKEQRVDLTVNKAASVSSSEYSEIEEKLAQCLGSDPAKRWEILNQLGDRPDYLAIAARTSGVGYERLFAYVTAWQIAGKINADLGQLVDEDNPGAGTYWPAGLGPLDPQVVYALVRLGNGGTLEQLLNLKPDRFFAAIVLAADRYLVDRAVETRLSTTLQREWQAVLAYYFGASNSNQWQNQLISLVIFDEAKRREVGSAYYSHPGTFKAFLSSLVQKNIIDDPVAENLLFVFQVYDALDQYFPMTEELYWAKAGRQWETVADLAKVKLKGEGGVAGWYDYALAQSQRYPEEFPGNIPGRTEEEKAEVYAQRLFDKFGGQAPDKRFADDAAAAPPTTSGGGVPPGFDGAMDFIEDHEDLDLSSTPVDKYVRENAPGTPDIVVDELKRLQRVYRLTQDWDVARALIEAGLDSAVKIADYDEEQFIADFEDKLGGLTQARAVHRKAKLYASEVYATLVRFNQVVNDVGGSPVLPANVNISTAAATTSGASGASVPGQKYPNWVTLFGHLNSCASRHCQTVLSPGAYLVDLLSFVSGAPKNVLFERRPDLTDLELTCPNTDRTVPYIDLVNEILGAVVAPHMVGMVDTSGELGPTHFVNAQSGGAAAERVFDVLRSAGYLLTERAIVKASVLAPGAEWVVEDDAWRFAIRTRPTGDTAAPLYRAYGAPQTSETGRLLEVFPEHYNPGAQALLESTVFPLHLPLALGREEVDLVLSRRGASRHAVKEAFQATLSTQEIWSSADIGRAYLRLTDAEENVIVGAGFAARVLWGFGSATPSVPRPEDPTQRASGPWLDVLSEMSVFLHRSGLTYNEVLELIDGEFVHDTARISIAAGRTQGEADTNILECNYNRFLLTNLTEQAARRLSFFLRLRRHLGWDIYTLDRVLMLVFGGQPLPSLTPVAQFLRVVDDTGLSPLQLCGVWSLLDTRRTERHPRSLFDEIYLRADPAASEYRAFDALARNNQPVQFADTPPPASGSTQSPVLQTDALKTYLRGALRLTAEALDALWGALVTSNTLDRAQLWTMYRIASFCRAARLPVADYYTATQLLGTQPFPAISDASQKIVATASAWLDVARLMGVNTSASELAYLLRDTSPEGADLRPAPQAVQGVHQLMASRGSELAARYPLSPQLDATFVRTVLEEVLAQDKAGRVVSVLETSAATPTAEDVAVLLSHFPAFWPGVSQADVLALLSDGDSVARYAQLWVPLRSFLVSRARQRAALQIATDTTGSSLERVDRLLTRSLTSVESGSQSAIVDWIGGLGGFTSGEEALEKAIAGSWDSRWVVPSDGRYTFVVESYEPDPASPVGTTPPGQVTLQLAGPSLAGQTASLQDRLVTTFDAGVRKAGEVVELHFAYSGGLRVSLLVQRDSSNPSVLGSDQLSPFNEEAYRKLDKALRLIKGLGLDNAELEYVLTRTPTLLDTLPLSSAQPVAWSSISGLLDQLRLNRAVRLDRTSLVQLLLEPTPSGGQPDPVEDTTRIAALTGWKREDIQAVLGLWPSPPPAAPAPPSLRSIDTWFVLRRCLVLTQRIDLRAAQIIDLLVGQRPSGNPSGNLVPREPSAAVAVALRDSLRSHFTDDAWRETFKPVRDQLRQRERDALVGYLTTRQVLLPSGQRLEFIDANDLFAYFLIDVEMEPDTQISRIKLALNSVQLFVQRVFLGLEPTKALRQLEKKQEQWSWMANYRVWEANRKVFLYPENWIEPELRDDKTELFKQLEEELLQDEVTSERGRLLLAQYLERLEDISDLIVVGACSEGVFYAGRSNVVHIVARTRTAPYTYYHRSFEGRQFHDGVFTPWRRVPLEIDAKSVAPVVVDGALRLFWPMVALKDKIAPNGENKDALGSKAEIRLMWSSLVPNLGEWSKPRLGQAKVFDEWPVTVFERDQGQDGPDTSFYHFRTGVEGKSVVKVEVYKTQFPTESDTGIHPKKLGTFNVTAAGDEFVDSSSSSPSPGNNLPVGAYLLYNAAIEYPGEEVEDAAAGDTFAFRGTTPFFSYHTAPFRSVVTNFGYLAADNEPFFFETPDVHLFALHRETTRTEGASPVLNQRSVFLTFNHPQLSELKSRFNANGPKGIMNRLTQALPVSDGRYYYNFSGNRVSSTKGGYISGYNNRYNGYYGGIYLGYHIAGDRMAWGVAQRDFESFHEPGVETVELPYPMPTVEFGYGTPFGIYNWELFFHLPMLIAGRLNQEMRFEEAMNWYHSVFDPRLDLNNYEKGRRFPYRLPRGARYWNFLPFFANKDATDTLLDVFGVTESLSKYERANLAKVIDEWRHHPFNPHLIARQRIAAYQKSVVMKYLENLIAWGDQLFRRDTFESINQATQLYVLAAEILGDRPEVIEPLVKEPRYTYRELFAQGISPFSNALVEVENLMVANSPHVDGKHVDAAPAQADSPQRAAIASLYFRVPRNEKLDGYWDTVADRLFKIRNSMNIDGIKRQLALFEPPIDPALLVKAAAAGVDLSSALSQLNQPLPYYRFNVWNAKAQDLANELKSFGGSLLAALEKRDAEALQLLRQTHELRLMGLVKKVREEQVKEAQANIDALDASRALAEDRLSDYSTREFMSGSETGAMVLTAGAATLELTSGVFSTIAGAVGVVPQVEAGAFSATAQFGGLHLSQVFQAIATGFSTGAGVARNAAAMMSTLAGYERRQEDWDLQIRQAQLEISQLEKQRIAAEIRLKIAEREFANHEVQIQQAEEVDAFLRDKFTNRDLYQWMLGELSRTFRQVYNLAYDVAKTAERAFQFELGITETSYIQFGYFDSLKQGLLSGEKLSYDLKRMDIAYLQKDKREFEITKPISLASVNPQALQALRENGSCTFSLPEVLFDLDFPGHYFRRIQAVRLTIPCVTGPYTSVSAKLSILGSAIRVQSTADAAGYAYQGVDDPRFVHDIGGVQSIATSTAQDDAGLFELNFRDERYLPFEGAGAISRWRLELPESVRQFDYHTISDVIVSLSYTARDAGGTLKAGATNNLDDHLNRVLDALATSDTGLGRVFSMKREFPDALHQLLTTGTTRFNIVPEHFPYLLRQKNAALALFDSTNPGQFSLKVIGRDAGAALTADLNYSLNDASPPTAVTLAGTGVASIGVTRGTEPLVANWQPEAWTLSQVDPANLTLTPNNVDDILFELKYTVAF